MAIVEPAVILEVTGVSDGKATATATATATTSERGKSELPVSYYMYSWAVSGLRYSVAWCTCFKNKMEAISHCSSVLKEM